jgi:hypothetical protein
MPRKKTQARPSSPPQLMLTRADNGDWSLHPPAAMLKEKDELTTLMSGTARLVGEQWDHPDKRDYELAWEMFAHHLSRGPA